MGPSSSKKPKILQRLFQVYLCDISNNIIEFCLSQTHSVVSRNKHFLSLGQRFYLVSLYLLNPLDEIYMGHHLCQNSTK